MSDLAAPLPGHQRLRWRSVSAIWWRHVLALSRVWKVAVTWFAVEPVFVLLAVALGIGQLVGDVGAYGSYPQFVAPGIVVGTAMFHAIFECSWAAFQRIQQSVYETILTAPVTVAEIVLAELAFAITRALISTLAVGIAAALFGWIPWPSLVALMLVSVGVGTVFGGIGLLFAALSPTVHSLSLVFTLVATPLYFFSGAFFPVSVLPEWLQPIAWAAPLTPLVHLGRGVVLGQLDATHAWAAVYVIVLSLALFPLAVTLLKRRLLK
ncbi:MAG: ABC transporter permease [Pseudomonadales bacterium]